jgi:heme-degrading monooxygenase HmoA
VWYGSTTRANADEYERLLREEILPGIQARGIDGYGGAHLFRREHDGAVEFMTLLWFDSMDAVRAFAGDDYETSVVPPAAAALLERHDLRSARYDVRMSPD